MGTFARRLTTAIVAALTPLAFATVAVPAVSSAQCASGWSFDSTTSQCSAPAEPTRLIPPPSWYQAPPPWAPPWAPQGVPPPPPTPPWAPAGVPAPAAPWGTPPDITPVWDPAHKAWGIWMGPTWVPL